MLSLTARASVVGTTREPQHLVVEMVNAEHPASSSVGAIGMGQPQGEMATEFQPTQMAIEPLPRAISSNPHFLSKSRIGTSSVASRPPGHCRC